MTVVDRYLMAVRIFLPRSAQRDIIAELSDDIQLADRRPGRHARAAADRRRAGGHRRRVWPSGAAGRTLRPAPPSDRS